MGGFKLSVCDPRRETIYKFIDGGHLRAEFAKVAQQLAEHGLDLRFSMLELNRVGPPAKKVFYYDCVPPEASDGAHLKLFRRQPGCHIRVGHLTGEGPNRRQKEVDVLLAVDMLTHAMRGNYSRAILVAGDRDFRPLVESLVGHGIDVEVWYGRKKGSEELKAAADTALPFGTAEIVSWLNPFSAGTLGIPLFVLGEYPKGQVVRNVPGRAGKSAGFKVYKDDGAYVVAVGSPGQSPVKLARHESPDFLETFGRLIMDHYPPPPRVTGPG